MTNRALQVSSIRELIIIIVRTLLERSYYSRKDRWALLVWSISSSRMYVEERIESLVNRKWSVDIKSIQIMILDYRDHKFMIVSSLFDREEEMKRTMTWWGQVVDDIRYRKEERWISRKREERGCQSHDDTTQKEEDTYCSRQIIWITDFDIIISNAFYNNSSFFYWISEDIYSHYKD